MRIIIQKVNQILCQFKQRNKKKQPLYVFWTSHKHIKGADWENFGDALAPLLLNKMTGREVKWVESREIKGNKKVYLTIGSILQRANYKTEVWGSGIISSETRTLGYSKFHAVRGPISYSRVLASGIKMNPVFGDPAILTPYYFPIAKSKRSGKIVIIPHYVDYEEVINREDIDKNRFEILDLKNPNIEELLRKMATADFVFSSSLHGLIVSQSYGVPSVWVKFSDNLAGDDIKFNDYFLSVGIKLYKPYDFSSDLLNTNFHKKITLPNQEVLAKRQIGLIESCPFL